MFVTIAVPALLLSIVPLAILKHIFDYFRDKKDLRQYPGLNPFCGVTNLAYMYEIYKSNGFRTRRLFEAHKKNKVLRIGPNALSFADVRAIADIYGHNTPVFKGDMYVSTAGNHSSLLDSIDKKEHAEKRKRVAAAFALKNLEGWEHKVHDKCSRLLTQIDKQCGQLLNDSHYQAIDWRLWSNLFTIETIADIALSQNLGLLEAGNDLVTAETLSGTTYKAGFVASHHGSHRGAAPVVWSTDYYPLIKKLSAHLVPYFRESWKHSDDYDNIIRHLVSLRLRKREQGQKLEDFFQCLLENKDGSATGLPQGELEAEVNLYSKSLARMTEKLGLTGAVNAGSDTTAIALTHFMYCLLKNPDKLVKLRQELDACMDEAEIVPQYSKVRHCQYLRACLDESLRLLPPISFGLQRKTPPEGATVLNRWIPGNTSVSVPAYVAHRDPDVFPEPETYRPERWLDERAKEVQKYFIPFSTGSRGCIGRNITILEQTVLMATMVHRYDLELASPDWELTWEERFNLWPSSMPLKIKRRARKGFPVV